MEDAATPCEAWEDLEKNKTTIYSQMFTYVLQIILACAAFHNARRLAAHTNFSNGAGAPRNNQPPVRRQAAAAQPQVLHACVVQPSTFESDMPRLAPGEVMAGAVHTETNPVAGCTPIPAPANLTVVMATPIPR